MGIWLLSRACRFVWFIPVSKSIVFNPDLECDFTGSFSGGPKPIMKTKIIRLVAAAIVLLALSTLNSQLSTAFAQGTAFTYQGRLNVGGNPTTGIYDLQFTLFDSLTGGGLGGGIVGGPLTNSAIGVTNGLFCVTLDFGSGVFTGPNRWLEIAARTNGAVSFTTLAPRQPILPTPYAVMANSASNLLGNLSAGQLTGTLANGALPTSPNFSGTVTAGTFSGSGANLTSLNANNLASGTVPLGQLSGITGGQLAAATWQLATNLNGGNAALASNVVSGISITNAFITNSVFAGNGGGLTNLNASQLAGGTVPTSVLPGFQGINYQTVGGGSNNVASGQYATVGGGSGNVASSSSATVAGGQNNTANNTYATVGGGYNNSAGYVATIPGGT